MSAFSPDGTHLASGSADNTVRLWDLKSGKELQVLKGHTSSVKCIAFSPDIFYLIVNKNYNIRVSFTKGISNIKGMVNNSKPMLTLP